MVRNIHSIVRKMALLIKKAGRKKFSFIRLTICFQKVIVYLCEVCEFAPTVRGVIKVFARGKTYKGTRLGGLVHHRLFRLTGSAKASSPILHLIGTQPSTHLVTKVKTVLDSKGNIPPRTNWQVTQGLIHTEFFRCETCTVGRKRDGS